MLHVLLNCRNQVSTTKYIFYVIPQYNACYTISAYMTVRAVLSNLLLDSLVLTDYITEHSITHLKLDVYYSLVKNKK